MKNYTITVNGNVYDVTVEEGVQTSAPVVVPVQSAPVVKPVAPASVVTPTAKAPVATPAKLATGKAGSVKVNAPMPGKILAVKANPGQTVKRGDVLIILEAMKMENEVVAPSDGTVASIDVTVGNTVEAGDVIATLN